MVAFPSRVMAALLYLQLAPSSKNHSKRRVSGATASTTRVWSLARAAFAGFCSFRSSCFATGSNFGHHMTSTSGKRYGFLRYSLTPVAWSGVIKVTSSVWVPRSPASRRLGCLPSFCACSLAAVGYLSNLAERWSTQ